MYYPTLVGDAAVLLASPGHEIMIDPLPNQLWASTTIFVGMTTGHWGLADDGTSTVAVDLRTGAPVGTIRAGNGHEVTPLILPVSHGFLAKDRDNATGLHLVMFDNCGKEQWTLDVPGTKVCTGYGLVGPNEVVYLGVGSCAGGEPQPELLAIDISGKLVHDPFPTMQGPWAIGADGTIYMIETGLHAAPSKLTALSPNFAPMWTVEIPGTLRNRSGVVLADDGVLYAQLEGMKGNAVIAIQTTSPGLASSSWPTGYHDNHRTNWGGGTF